MATLARINGGHRSNADDDVDEKEQSCSTMTAKTEWRMIWYEGNGTSVVGFVFFSPPPNDEDDALQRPLKLTSERSTHATPDRHCRAAASPDLVIVLPSVVVALHSALLPCSSELRTKAETEVQFFAHMPKSLSLLLLTPADAAVALSVVGEVGRVRG